MIPVAPRKKRLAIRTVSCSQDKSRAHPTPAREQLPPVLGERKNRRRVRILAHGDLETFGLGDEIPDVENVIGGNGGEAGTARIERGSKNVELRARHMGICVCEGYDISQEGKGREFLGVIQGPRCLERC